MAENIKFVSDDRLHIMLRDGWTPIEVRELIASYKQLKMLAARHKRIQQLIPFEERASYRPANFAELSEEEKWTIDKSLGLLDWDGRTNEQPNQSDDGS